MGVHDLWKLLDPAKRSFRLEELEGKVLAIDASIWLNQFVKAIADDPKKGQSSNVPLKALLSRVFKLFFYGIKPVFVFDGYTPDIKKRTTLNRRKTREKSKEEAEKTRQRMVLQKFILQSRKDKGSTLAPLPSGFLKEPDPTKGLEEPMELDDDSLNEIEFVEVDDFVSEKRKEKGKIKSLKKVSTGHEKDDPFEIEDEEDDEGDVAVLSSKPSPKSLQSEMLRNRLETFPFDRKVLAELPLEIQEEVFAEYERLKEGVYNEFDVDDANLTAFSSLQLKSIVVQGNVKRKMRDNNEIIRQQVLTRRIASDGNMKYVLIEENKDQEAIDPLSRLTSELNVDPPPPRAPQNPSNPNSSLSPIKKRSLSDHSMSSTSKRPRLSELPPPSQILNINSEEEDLMEVSPPHPLAQVPSPLLPKKSSDVDSFEDIEWVDEDLAHHESHNPKSPHSPIAPSNPLDALFPGFEERSQLSKKIFVPLEVPSMDTSFDKVLSNVQSELKPVEINSSFEVAELSPPRQVRSPARPSLAVSSPPSLSKTGHTNPPADISPIPIVDSQSAASFLEAVPKPSSKSILRVEVESESQAESRKLEFDNSIIEVDKKEVVDPEKGTEDFEVEEVEDLEVNRANEEVEDDEAEGEDEDEERAAADLNEDELSDYELEQRRKKGGGNPPETEKDVIDILDEDPDGRSVHPFFVGHAGVDENLAVNEQLFRENIVLTETAERKSRQAKSLSEQLLADTKSLLACFGIPFIVSPAEADSQCAELERLDLVDGIISDDSDMFVFGAKNVFRNCFSQAKDLFHYNMDAIERICALDRDDLISLAQLLGSDYAQGVNGVGIVLAMEIIAEFRGATSYETLINFRDWINNSSKAGFEGAHSDFEKKHGNLRKKLSLRSNFPEIEVELAYKQPDINSTTEKFTWADINLTESKRFFEEKFNWDERDTLGKLKPILDKIEEHRNRSQNGLRQQSLGAYFAPWFISIGEGVDPVLLGKKIKSKRLLEVVKKLQRIKKGLPPTPEKDLEEVGLEPKPKKKRTPRKKKSDAEEKDEVEPHILDLDEEPREKAEPKRRGRKRKATEEVQIDFEAQGEFVKSTSLKPPKRRRKSKASEVEEKSSESAMEVADNDEQPDPTKWAGRFRSKRPTSFADNDD